MAGQEFSATVYQAYPICVVVVTSMSRHWCKLIQNRGKTDEDIELEWKRLSAMPDAEGSGPNQKVWVQKNATRMRDVTRYHDFEVNEGSKAMRDLKDKDKAELVDFTTKDAGDFGSDFFRSAAAAQGTKKRVLAEDADESVCNDAKKKKGQRVEVVFAAPKAVEKADKARAALEPTANKIDASMEDALKLASENRDENDKALHTYERTAKVRHAMLKLWQATSFAEAERLADIIEGDTVVNLAGIPARRRKAMVTVNDTLKNDPKTPTKGDPTAPIEVDAKAAEASAGAQHKAAMVDDQKKSGDGEKGETGADEEESEKITDGE